MDIGAILVGFSVLIVSTVYIANPFLKKQNDAGRKGTQEKLGNLTARRQAVLSALSDLEFDFKTGKVAVEDYQSLRAQLLLHAASLLPKDEEKPDNLENLIQARRQKLKEGSVCGQCGAIQAPGDRFCSHCGASSRQRCQECNQEVSLEDRFCSHCGANVCQKT